MGTIGTSIFVLFIIALIAAVNPFLFAFLAVIIIIALIISNFQVFVLILEVIDSIIDFVTKIFT